MGGQEKTKKIPEYLPGIYLTIQFIVYYLETERYLKKDVDF